MAEHQQLATGEIHIPYQWSYADATARLAATGFVIADVGKLARQLDDNSLWMLTDDSPETWIAIASAGAAVTSVNTQTGAVVLDADDIADTATNVFATPAELTKLAGIETLADVTDATNVDAAGATMNADTTLAGNGYFLDEDDMVSNSATKVPSQQSTKAYVDAQVAGGGYTDEMARDALGVALVPGNNIDITVDDALNTITIDVEVLTSADLTDFNEASQDAVGTILTDSVNIDFTYADATPSITADLTTAAKTFTLNFIIDGGGAVITTGIKGDVMIDRACTITAWTALADVSGSIVVDIWGDTYANFPPTVADTITTSEKPTITTATKGQDTSLNGGAGWAISAGLILRFNVDSITTCQRVTIALKCVAT